MRGIGEVGVEVAAADLDVDRRGQAEIQDLRRDVARQEAEIGAGKALRQAGTQDPAIAVDRRGLVVERDRDVAVLAADRAGVAVGLVDAADRQAAVHQRAHHVAGQQVADLLLHQHGDLARLLDPRADRRAHVQIDLARLDAGEEILAGEQQQQQ